MSSKNKIELLGYYGSDITVAQSAWTSTYRELTSEKLNRVEGLIKHLWGAGHETPFEKTSIHFLVSTDIATHIQLLKHRIGVSINGESARYKEIKEDKYLIPEDWKGIECNVDVVFPGTDDEIIHSGEKWTDLLKKYTDIGNVLYHQAVTDLTPTLGRKRAKESARFFKTYNSQIESDVMFNLRSFSHFLHLRDDESSQKEIRDLAGEMLEIVKNIEGNPFKYSINAIEERIKLWKNGNNNN